MRNTKQVQQVLSAPAPHMVGDGFRVHNFFPEGYKLGMHRMSPFFLLDYNSLIDFPAREQPRGVGVHPHKGFETVTIAYHGKVAHHDSSGHSGVIGEGDVQWMTAGSGVLHKEYHEKGYSKTGGPFQMVQLWVNLSAKDKKSAPKYQTLSNDKLGRYTIPGDGGVVEVIAGEFKGTKGAASTFSPVEMYNIHIKKGATLQFDLPANYNTGILMVKGDVTINEDNPAKTDEFVLFKNEGETIDVKANEDSILLVLSGEPINEPIVAYGPFVMNTKEEIMEAFDEFNQGKYGYLED